MEMFEEFMFDKDCKKCPVNSVTTTPSRKEVVAVSLADCSCDVGYTGYPTYGISCSGKSIIWI